MYERCETLLRLEDMTSDLTMNWCSRNERDQKYLKKYDRIQFKAILLMTTNE